MHNATSSRNINPRPEEGKSIPRKTGILRLVGFASIPMVTALSPLIALPGVTMKYGASGWAAVAIGQSVGAACAVFIELGWGLNGPQRVASFTDAERAREFGISIMIRLTAFAIVAPLGGVISAHLAQDQNVTAALSSVASSAIGLSASWYFMGIGKPSSILVQEAIPKLILVILATILLFSGAPLAVYPLCLLIAALGSPIVASISLKPLPDDKRGVSWSDLRESLKDQRVALTGRAFSSLYIALPTTLVSIASPNSTALFAGAERMQRMMLGVLQSIPNSLQNWIGKAEGAPEINRRIRLAVTGNMALGAAAGFTFAIAAPWGARLLFSDTIEITHNIASLCGLIIFATMSSRATGSLALVRMNRIRAITWSAAIGCAFGVPLILIAASLYGAPGAIAAEGATELIVLSIQFYAMQRRSTPTESVLTKEAASAEP